MHSEIWRQRVAWLAMVGLIMLTGIRAHADDAGQGEASDAEVQADWLQAGLVIEPGHDAWRTARILFSAAPAGDVLVLSSQEDPKREELGKYWIGVHIHDVSAAMRAQLNLEEGQGVLVGEVVPDSPASKAAIKQYDIILAVDDHKVGRNEDLLKAIKSADGNEVKLTLLRGGSERSVKVTPTERPRRDAAGVAGGYEYLMQGFDVVKPSAAMVLSNRAANLYAASSMVLPEGLRITITREGTRPAKISIKQEGRELETTETKVRELPEDLRRYVEPMLGRPRATLSLGTKAPYAVPAQPAPPAAPRAVRPQPPADVLIPAPPGQEGSRKRIRLLPPEQAPEGVERRIEALERRLDELQRALRAPDEAKGPESK